MVFGRLANTGSEEAAARKSPLAGRARTDFRAMRAGQVEFSLQPKPATIPFCNS
jgi:hypothetical protein